MVGLRCSLPQAWYRRSTAVRVCVSSHVKQGVERVAVRVVLARVGLATPGAAPVRAPQDRVSSHGHAGAWAQAGHAIQAVGLTAKRDAFRAQLLDGMPDADKEGTRRFLRYIREGLSRNR
jgi:hypothetical protein